MIRRVLLAAVGIAALMAAAASSVVAAAFAFYTLLKDSVGAAGAAAIVAAGLALITAVVGLVVGAQAEARHHHPKNEPSLMEGLAEFARERPLLAASSALAAGLIALRNPQVVAGLVSAFLAGKTADKSDRRRGR